MHLCEYLGPCICITSICLELCYDSSSTAPYAATGMVESIGNESVQAKLMPNLAIGGQELLHFLSSSTTTISRHFWVLELLVSFSFFATSLTPENSDRRLSAKGRRNRTCDSLGLETFPSANCFSSRLAQLRPWLRRLQPMHPSS